MTKFIADIASNHDGSLERAKRLIKLASESGANYVKFQNFKASELISDEGFKLIGNIGHQKNWDMPVSEIYKRAELNRGWIPELAKTAKEHNVEFMSSPYDYEAVDLLEPYVSAYKIGSGDITYIELIKYIIAKEKPVFIATGASEEEEVYHIYMQSRSNTVLMQCNTNYTAETTNREHINLNYIDKLKQYGLDVGLSDHTKDNDIIIGAVAKGCKYIERHFTDDCTRGYPDHYFSMDASEFRNMVNSVRRFEMTLGNGIKKVEKNEEETRIIQRRAWYATKDMEMGHIITKDDIKALRPCGKQMVSVDIDIVGKILIYGVKSGQPINYYDIWEQNE